MSLPSDCALFIILDLMPIDDYFKVLRIEKILKTFSFLFNHLIVKYTGEYFVLYHGCFHYNLVLLCDIILPTHRVVT